VHYRAVLYIEANDLRQVISYKQTPISFQAHRDKYLLWVVWDGGFDDSAAVDPYNCQFGFG
jgi:hypothetical protein